jgi:chromosomal replication initiation ATPase DnaA
MQHLVKINELPVVQNIISNAEERIKQATGVNAKLMIAGFSNKEAISYKKILQQLTETFFQREWASISSKKRSDELVLARSFYIWVSVKLIHVSISQTARDLGGRNHATVIHALKLRKDDLADGTDKGVDLKEFIKQFENLTLTTHEKI